MQKTIKPIGPNEPNYKTLGKGKPITKEEKKKFLKSLLKNQLDPKKAYLEIRPGIEPKSAYNQGNKLVQDKTIIRQLQAVLEEEGLSKRNFVKYLNVAITSGIGKKATNRDAIQALRLVKDIYTGEEKDEKEASQADHLELLPLQELLEKAQSISNQLARISTIEAEEA